MTNLWHKTKHWIKQPSLTDWIIALFTIVLAVTSIYQWIEIKAGGVDTHTLAEAAKKQADKAETISASLQQAVKDIETSNAQAKHSLEQTLRQGKTALDASIAASRSDQRAYVTIGRPDGTVAEILWPKEDIGNAGLLVYFQNNGRLPARFNGGADSPIVAIVPTDLTITAYSMWKNGAQLTELPTNHMFQPMYRARVKKGNQMSWSGTIDIAGGSSYQGVLWEVPKDRMVQLINFENSLLLRPMGKFEYCDGFGKRICRRFNLRYAKEPYDRFFLEMEEQCNASEMQVIHPLPDYEYLPVCETLERPETQFTIPSLPKPQ
jgi:hypothetical protein